MSPDIQIQIQGRILAVDDEQRILLLRRRQFEMLGYEYLAETSAAKALEILEKDASQQPPTIALLMIDRNMPGMAGEIAARKARVIRPDLPILVVSSGADEYLQQFPDAFDAGLKKPYLMSQMEAAIQRAILNSRLRRGI